MTLAISALPVRVDQYFVAGDHWAWQFGPLTVGGEALDLREQIFECEYRDQAGTILATPDVEVYVDDPTIASVTLSPDTTRMLTIAADRIIWGIRWTDVEGRPRTLVFGDVFVTAEIVLTSSSDLLTSVGVSP